MNVKSLNKSAVENKVFLNMCTTHLLCEIEHSIFFSLFEFSGVRKISKFQKLLVVCSSYENRVNKTFYLIHKKVSLYHIHTRYLNTCRMDLIVIEKANEEIQYGTRIPLTFFTNNFTIH